MIDRFGEVGSRGWEAAKARSRWCPEVYPAACHGHGKASGTRVCFTAMTSRRSGLP